MNIQQGLNRISAVVWGLFAIICLFGMVLFFASEGWADGAPLLLLGGVVVCGIAHKTTKWVVSGFFTPKN